MAELQKKTIFSGIQPSGVITIGNYIGAIKNWVNLQEDYNGLYCVVDMHAITVKQEPAELRNRARDLLTLYIACGINPEQNILYYQSHVPQHAELGWILNCYTYMGELNRMTQFKDKSKKHEVNINAGLFTYPVLMAADILLFQTDLVPIGDDQVQHLELARDIATRFNSIYGDTFKVPDKFVGKVGARVRSLQDATKKMSKSDENPNGYISMLDEPAVMANKIKRSVTDSLGIINYTDEQPGIKNLIDMHASLSGESVESILNRFQGQGYAQLKQEVADVVVGTIEPIQIKFKQLKKEKDYIDSIIKKNAETAQYLANKTLRKVKKKVGFPPEV